MIMRLATFLVWRAIRPVVLVAAAGLVIGGGLRAQDEPEAQPVFVGGEAAFDACGTYGAVGGLKPTPGNFLALRSRPTTDGALLAKLPNEQPLWLCAEEGDWIGVVVPQDGANCGVASPKPVRQPYSGPCASGWVFGKYVVPLAG